MARALVLGATGHIGAHIVRALLRAGHDVRASYRTPRFLRVLGGLPVERVRVDLETLDGLPQALAGCDWVFHAAGYYPGFQERRQQAIERGIRSTRRVIEAIRQAQPGRVVFTSSASTIRRLSDRLATEQDAEPWPLTRWRPLYAAAKIAMEHEVLEACLEGVPAVIVNPSVCVGEYDARPFSGRFILAFAKHRLPVYVEHTLNVIYTGDVGIGHLRAAERGQVGRRYLLTAHQITLEAFASLVARLAGIRPPRWRIPYRLALAAAVVSEGAAWITRQEPVLPRRAIHALRQGQLLDGTNARVELDLPQTPIEEALRLAIAWFREQGYL